MKEYDSEKEVIDNGVDAGTTQPYFDMTPEQFVLYVASDYVELSQEKVRWQRDDYIKMARAIRGSM